MEALAMTGTFWRNKRILLTGHTGFKGAWLSLWLQSMGATVIGYSMPPPTRPSLFDVANVSEDMESIIGDIRDIKKVISAMEMAQPDIVFHMAAQPLVRRSYVDPVETYTTNVIGTVNVLEAVRQTSSVRVVVNITSDKCYDNKEWVWGYRENDRLGGHDPYSNSKACAELVASAYRCSFFLNSSQVALASVRAGNVIGGGDWAHDRLIPDVLRAISNKQPIILRNPHAIRPWQHVLEPLYGYMLLAQRLYEDGKRYAESWNFGPNDEDAKPVQWVVEELMRLLGIDAGWQLDESGNPHEAHYLKLDCSKARSYLNWQPRWSLRHALAEIADWHAAYINNENMKYKTLEQITKFMHRESL